MSSDLITAVALSKKGALVTVNHGEETLYISREYWQERTFQENQEIDLAEVRKWLLPRQYPEALNYAVSLLALRARSTGEIRQKLLARHYMEDTADMVLFKLEKERFVNDEAFARDYAAQLSRRRLGKNRILQELKMKGIPSAMAQEALSQLDQEEAMEGAAQLAVKLMPKYAKEADPRKGMQKWMAAMLRRGYGFEEAKAAIEEALKTAQQED